MIKLSDKLEGLDIRGVSTNNFNVFSTIDLTRYLYWDLAIENIDLSNTLTFKVIERYVSIVLTSVDIDVLPNGGIQEYSNGSSGGKLNLMTQIEISAKSKVSNLHAQFKVNFLGWVG